MEICTGFSDMGMSTVDSPGMSTTWKGVRASASSGKVILDPAGTASQPARRSDVTPFNTPTADTPQRAVVTCGSAERAPRIRPDGLVFHSIPSMFFEKRVFGIFELG